MTQVCSDVVPESLIKKYRIRLISTKDPYSIYQLDHEPSSYMLIFRFADMTKCRTLRMTDMENLDCRTVDGVSKNLFFRYGHHKCYNFTMSLTSELKKHCGARDYEENMQSAYYFTNHEENHVIISNSTAGVLLGTSTLILCLIISLLMFTILHWKASRL
nr:CG13538-PA [Drosophila erecta]